MKKEDNGNAWKRIESVVQTFGGSPCAFARLLNVNSQNIYQIKCGNNGISLALARKINEHFPRYSIGWLISGEHVPIIRLPLYESPDSVTLQKVPVTANYFYLSQMDGREAQFAAEFETDAPDIPKNLRRLILLLRQIEVTEMQAGNLYFFATTKLNGLYTVDCAKYSQNFKLMSAMSAQHETLLIAKKEVLSVWHVCSMVCAESYRSESPAAFE